MMFGVITLVWVINILKNNQDVKNKIQINAKEIRNNHKGLIFGTLLFVLGATIGVFVSVDTRAALGAWKAFYVEPIILAFILITTIKEKKDIQLILSGLVLCGFFTSILAIYQHFTGWLVPEAFWTNRNTYRVTAWYGFPNAVGLFLAPLFPLALSVIPTKSGSRGFKKLSLTTNILFLPLSILAIYFAKSTGAIIGLIAGLGILLLINKKTRLPTIILGIASVIVLFSLPRTNIIRQELFFQDRSGQLRLDMWAETIEYLLKYPIAGAGLASYEKVIYPYRIDKWIEVFHHPHNLFLTMWVNIGLIGLIGFVWILVWFYRTGIQQVIKKNTAVPYLVAAMTTIMVMGLVDSPYIKNDLVMIFWVLPVLLLISTKDT
jgi:O-antigen ligase